MDDNGISSAMKEQIKRRYTMRKKLKQRYEDLYKQNITSLMKDEKEIEKIEQRIDKKHMDRLGS